MKKDFEQSDPFLKALEKNQVVFNTVLVLVASFCVAVLILKAL